MKNKQHNSIGENRLKSASHAMASYQLKPSNSIGDVMTTLQEQIEAKKAELEKLEAIAKSNAEIADKQKMFDEAFSIFESPNKTTKAKLVDAIETLKKFNFKRPEIEKPKTVASKKKRTFATGIMFQRNEYFVEYLLRNDFEPSDIVHIFKAKKKLDIENGIKPLSNGNFYSVNGITGEKFRSYALERYDKWNNEETKDNRDNFVSCKLGTLINMKV